MGLLFIVLLVGVLAASCGGSDKTEATWTAPASITTQTPQSPASIVPAPVESVEIERVAAKPPNATMIVVSGLPSGCDSFNGYNLTREGDAFTLEVTNLKRDLDCPATYTTVTTSILLGQPAYSNIEPCKTYTVVVNGETRSVQSSCPIIESGQFSEPPPTPVSISTPGPSREWDLKDIQVDGSTVIVPLHVFAGIDVLATLDGREPDEINAPFPILEFIFHNVTPGPHTVEVRDVVGFSETAEVVVPTSGIPEWLTGLIQRLENEPVANPPALIAQYEYNGQPVYFVPQRCCDIFSDLFDADGSLIAHPDGGITGRGDGRASDFFQERKDEQVIWRDHRPYGSSLLQVQAPIESVEVLIMESFPPQYMLLIVSGLPNACVTFGGYYLDRDSDTIRVEISNRKPADPKVLCAQVYGTVETRITLGIDFESRKTYKVVVNDVTETFVAQ